MHSQRNFVLNVGFGRSPTSVFEVGFEKPDSKLVSGYQLALLAAVANAKNPEQKITVRFKLNLKTDGPDYKMIFKFGKRVERFHSCSKQCLRIYKDYFCVAKTLVGKSQTLELHPIDAGYAIASLNKIDQVCCAFDKWMCSAEPSKKTSATTKEIPLFHPENFVY